jgi:hypothetical protein
MQREPRAGRRRPKRVRVARIREAPAPGRRRSEPVDALIHGRRVHRHRVRRGHSRRLRRPAVGGRRAAEAADEAPPNELEDEGLEGEREEPDEEGEPDEELPEAALSDAVVIDESVLLLDELLEVEAPPDAEPAPHPRH